MAGILGVCLTKKCAERKHAEKLAKIEAKTERKAIKQWGRTQRNSDRAEVRAIAYQNGMDPRSFVSDIVGQSVNAAATFGMAAAGNPEAIAAGNFGGFLTNANLTKRSDSAGNGMIWIFAIGFFLWLINKR